jgi:hypothetical protein
MHKRPNKLKNNIHIGFTSVALIRQFWPLFASLFGCLFSRWWAVFAALLALQALAIYTLIVGACTSKIRAAIMGGQ